MKLTENQEVYRKKLIKATALTDTYKRVYKDDAGSWQELLNSNFGKSSRRDLTITQLKSLLNFLKTGKFFEVKPKMRSEQQYYKILRFWTTEPCIRDKSNVALREFIKNKIHKDVSSDLKELTKSEATKIIIALNKMKENALKKG